MRLSSDIRYISIAALCALWACSSATTGKFALGGVCDGQNDVCASGLCVTVDTETSICSRLCSKPSDCTSGFVCANVPNVGDVCLPGGLDGHCVEDKQCSAGFECDTTAGVCYIPVTRTLCSPCTSSLQCPTGGFCRPDENEQSCTTPCTSGTCPTGYTCASVSGATGMQCIPSNTDQTCGQDLGLCASCHQNGDCGGVGSQCVENLASNEMFCATGCKMQSDCTTGFSCTDLSGVGSGPNVCVPVSGTCVGYCDSSDATTVRRQCGIAAGCDTMTNQCQPKMDGTVCAECNTDDDCVKFVADASCLENDCSDCPFAGQKFCSIQCDPTVATSCETGFTCTAVGTDPSAPTFCIPDSGSCTTGGEELGDDCTAIGADACLSGICIGLGSESVCSAECMTAADCGNAQYTCCNLSTDGMTFDCSTPVASNGGVCAPLGGAFGADCSPGQPPCYQGVCLNLGTADVCSSICTMDSDCPTNFTCRQGEQQNGDGTTTQVSVCFPAGGGGLGADCTFGPAACESTLCLEKPTGNICTQACGTTPCPSGYQCLSEASSTDASQKEQVCSPL